MKVPAAQLLGGLALACWLCAWFLPVLGNYSGWDAFLAALRGPFLESAPTRGDDAIAQLLSALDQRRLRGVVRRLTAQASRGPGCT